MSAEDDWEKLTHDVTPISKPYLEPEVKPIKPISIGHDHSALPRVTEVKYRDLPELVGGSYSNIDKATIRKLKRGHLPPEETLDLHGLTKPQAYGALENCLGRSYLSGKRVLLIITGKGRLSEPSVLKSALPEWLNTPALRPYVLAFGPARREDGGSGAFYVLLKKRKNDG